MARKKVKRTYHEWPVRQTQPGDADFQPHPDRQTEDLNALARTGYFVRNWFAYDAQCMSCARIFTGVEAAQMEHHSCIAPARHRTLRIISAVPFSKN